ncbi:MAG: hypothetical protein Q4F60_02670 [Candidatus Saccharibacteria bacterium]|nr:hypothetical protein [Candidatus Saccharibacteria bacterium]
MNGERFNGGGNNYEGRGKEDDARRYSAWLVKQGVDPRRAERIASDAFDARLGRAAGAAVNYGSVAAEGALAEGDTRIMPGRRGRLENQQSVRNRGNRQDVGRRVPRMEDLPRAEERVARPARNVGGRVPRVEEMPRVDSTRPRVNKNIAGRVPQVEGVRMNRPVRRAENWRNEVDSTGSRPETVWRREGMNVEGDAVEHFMRGAPREMEIPESRFGNFISKIKEKFNGGAERKEKEQRGGFFQRNKKKFAGFAIAVTAASAVMGVGVNVARGQYDIQNREAMSQSVDGATMLESLSVAAGEKAAETDWHKLEGYAGLYDSDAKLGKYNMTAPNVLVDGETGEALPAEQQKANLLEVMNRMPEELASSYAALPEGLQVDGLKGLSSDQLEDIFQTNEGLRQQAFEGFSQIINSSNVSQTRLYGEFYNVYAMKADENAPTTAGNLDLCHSVTQENGSAATMFSGETNGVSWRLTFKNGCTQIVIEKADEAVAQKVVQRTMEIQEIDNTPPAPVETPAETPKETPSVAKFTEYEYAPIKKNDEKTDPVIIAQPEPEQKETTRREDEKKKDEEGKTEITEEQKTDGDQKLEETQDAVETGDATEIVSDEQEGVANETEREAGSQVEDADINIHDERAVRDESGEAITDEQGNVVINDGENNEATQGMTETEAQEHVQESIEHGTQTTASESTEGYDAGAGATGADYGATESEQSQQYAAEEAAAHEDHSNPDSAAETDWSQVSDEEMNEIWDAIFGGGE